MKILGIDPGNHGALVLLSERRVRAYAMPLDEGSVSFTKLVNALTALKPDHTFLERAVPFAMGTKGAFTYGRGFAAIEIALQVLKFPTTYVEPSKWTKELFQGIDKRLKPKERGRLALKRLFPDMLASLPQDKKGVVHEGVMDALLIAEYGRRSLLGLSPEEF